MDNSTEVQNQIVETTQQEESKNEITSINKVVNQASKNEMVESDAQVYSVIKSNAKLFMAEFAKLQMQNMVDNSDRLNKLQGNLMSSLATETDPELITKGIDVIRKCQETNINLMSKLINDNGDNNIIYNDNRQVNNTTNNDVKINLSDQSKEKLRLITNQIIDVLKEDNQNNN